MYYAVRQGWFRGVFLDKRIAVRATKGHPNPKTQDFFSRDVADKYVYNDNKHDHLVVYTDGSYRNKYHTSGFGVFFGRKDDRNVYGPMPRTYKQTSQKAEAYAALIALCITTGDIEIRTDSLQLVYCAIATRYKKMPSLYATIRALSKHRNVIWTYIKAHAGYYGNENADKLAKNGSLPHKFRYRSDETYRDVVLTDLSVSTLDHAVS